MEHQLPALPYAQDALAPFMSAETLSFHYGKHHQAYVDNLNKALAGTDGEGKSIEELMAGISKLPAAVRNNGGGHFNHTFFWNELSPNGGGEPVGTLSAAIDAKFGSYSALKDEFKKACVGRFGSGWAWLCVDSKNELCVCSTPNQDNPLMDLAECPGTPIIGLDVWEHAYYLKFQNKRPDYVDAFWNVVDWNAAEARFKATK